MFGIGKDEKSGKTTITEIATYTIKTLMADDLEIISGSKEEKYLAIIPQLKALIAGEIDIIANLANIAAALKEQFNFFWIGFYLVKQNELVLGPFQGPVACTRIALGRGVCGASWQQKQTIIVPNVDAFPGHIACSSISKSEIVVPIIRQGVVIGVLDADSSDLNGFDESDSLYLNKIVNLINFESKI